MRQFQIEITRMLVGSVDTCPAYCAVSLGRLVGRSRLNEQNLKSIRIRMPSSIVLFWIYFLNLWPSSLNVRAQNQQCDFKTLDDLSFCGEVQSYRHDGISHLEDWNRKRKWTQILNFKGSRRQSSRGQTERSDLLQVREIIFNFKLKPL